MIGTEYRFTGITLKYRGYDGLHSWAATAEFFDHGFSGDNAATGSVSTQGNLVTRYYVSDKDGHSGLEAAVNAILTEIKRFGIIPALDDLYLYLKDDDSSDIPEEELQRVRLLAKKLGYETLV